MNVDGICPNRMLAAFRQQLTTVLAQMLQQVATLHVNTSCGVTKTCEVAVISK